MSQFTAFSALWAQKQVFNAKMEMGWVRKISLVDKILLDLDASHYLSAVKKIIESTVTKHKLELYHHFIS
jgi:hypothetical protein